MSAAPGAMRPPPGLPLLALAAVLVAGCATGGDYVWVDRIKPVPRRADADLLIAPGDVLGVRVSGQESLSTTALVRADGRISLPLVGEQVAAGLTPSTLSQFLDAQFQTFLKSPVVTVVLEQQHPEQISVFGQVNAPGAFRAGPGTSVLQAIALAGGLSPWARRDRIFVLRHEFPGQPPMRIRFRYRALLDAEWRAIAFELRDGDVVVAE